MIPLLRTFTLTWGSLMVSPPRITKHSISQRPYSVDSDSSNSRTLQGRVSRAGIVGAAACVAASVWFWKNREEDQEKLLARGNIAAIKTLESPKGLKEYDGADLLCSSYHRWLTAYSIATDINYPFELLVYNLIIGRKFKRQEVHEFIEVLIEQMASSRAHPNSRKSIGKWLFILKDQRDPHYGVLLQRLYDKGILTNLLQSKELWYGIERFYAPEELRADIKKFVTKVSM